MKHLKTFENFVKEKSADDPCWDGYEMIGMKKKKGKEVPNCVPQEESVTEGYMSELDIIRQESKNLQEFIKKAKTEFPQISQMKEADVFLHDLWEMGNKID
jgi:DNA mismatch repair ATPase MutS